MLVDTHVFLWWISDDPRLSKRARQILQSPDQLRILSAASLWEIALKLGTGKLRLGKDPKQLLSSMISAYRLETLSIQPSHTLATFELPDHHKDPFDRLLVAQCIVEGLTLLTDDGLIRLYSVPVVW